MYHILIVDEEEHLLWALERNLFPERADVVVHTAGTGEEGLEILQDESIDLLISDIKMPGDVDGFQLILRAKEMVPDARVMIITAFGTNRIQNFAERIGISHYIEKPFTVDELRNAVLEILDEKEGFQGVLSDLELTDIIQMLCLAKRTALLHLKHRDHRGRIVFEAGAVTHAEFDGEVGPDAVFEMLELRQGDIFMQSDFDETEQTIDMGWQDLLLEGVKRTDEQRLERQREQTRQEMKDGGAKQTPVSNPDPAARTKTPMGMGAPTMDNEMPQVPQASESSLEESSSMLFSEEELEEISRASEAAVEVETVESDEDQEAGDDARDRGQPAPAPAPEAQPAQKPSNPQVVTEQAGVGDEGWAELEADVDRSQNGQPQGQPAPAPLQSDVGQNDSENAGAESNPPFGAGSEFEDASDSPFSVGAGRLGGDSQSLAQDDSWGSDTAIAEPDNHQESRQSRRKRRRSDTSPGMATVAPPMPAETTEDSGEYELFAAPALNGRHSRDQAPADSPDEMTAAIEEFMGECPGLKATAVLSAEDGGAARYFNLAYDDGLDQQLLTPRLREVFSRASRSVNALHHQDQLQELQLVLDDSYLLMRAIDEKALIHLAIVDRKVSLGIALVLMRQFASRFAEI